MLDKKRLERASAYIKNWSGRGILSATHVAERLSEMGFDVRDKTDDGERCMVVDDEWIPIFTAEEEGEMLREEGRGGYVEQTPEFLAEELDLAFALFRVCFPGSAAPERFHGRSKTMDSVKRAFRDRTDATIQTREAQD